MTNEKIIINEAIRHEIYTEHEVIEILKTGANLPIHTYAAWRSMGYQVQKGEKAAIKTKLWKPVTKKNKESEENEVKMIMVNAALFTKEQVQKIETA